MAQVTGAAKALAEEEGLDLSSIEGTGSGGRITKADVEAALAADREPAPDELPEEGDELPEYVRVRIVGATHVQRCAVPSLARSLVITRDWQTVPRDVADAFLSAVRAVRVPLSEENVEIAPVV